jgi:hypothetical protein
VAQEELDLDSDDRSSSRRESRKALEDEVVREIERGTYLKASGGTTFYFLNRGSVLRAGTTVNLTLGRDFISKDKFSFAGELIITQALHNGTPYQNQINPATGLPLPANQLIQGDIHTFGFMLGAEASAYPVRRFGVGGRVGAGVMLVPVLMESTAYETDVVGTSSNSGAWFGIEPAVHTGPKFMAFIGPTFEYYTKLSHFSLGLDIDVIYVLDLDLGASATVFLKYTF